jgi:circadian clock protein KaiB
MSKYLLRLFVSGKTQQSERAIADLHRICEEEYKGEYQTTVIDVLENPEMADAAKIRVTPTVIKDLPPPIRRIIGDLSSKERVLIGLELRAAEKGKERCRATDL